MSEYCKLLQTDLLKVVKFVFFLQWFFLKTTKKKRLMASKYAVIGKIINTHDTILLFVLILGEKLVGFCYSLLYRSHQTNNDEHFTYIHIHKLQVRPLCQVQYRELSNMSPHKYDR